MKMPAEKRTHCPSCRKHTIHEVQRVKKRKASELKAGQRQFRRVMSGYRGFPRPQLKGAGKPTKKVSIVLRCKTCSKAHNVKGFRARTFDIVEA